MDECTRARSQVIRVFSANKTLWRLLQESEQRTRYLGYLRSAGSGSNGGCLALGSVVGVVVTPKNNGHKKAPPEKTAFYELIMAINGKSFPSKCFANYQIVEIRGGGGGGGGPPTQKHTHKAGDKECKQGPN